MFHITITITTSPQLHILFPLSSTRTIRSPHPNPVTILPLLPSYHPLNTSPALPIKPTLLLQIRQTRRRKQFPIPRTSNRPRRHDEPQEDNGDSHDGADDVEEGAGHFVADLDCAEGEDAEGEGETPPAHVEGEGSALFGGEVLVSLQVSECANEER